MIDIKKINIERKAPQNVREPRVGVFDQVPYVHMFLYKSLWLRVPWGDTFIRDYEYPELSHFVLPTTIGLSPYDYALTLWSLGDLDVIFQNAIHILFF